MNVREVSKIRTILNLGEGGTWVNFCWVLKIILWLASQSPYPIIVYSVSNVIIDPILVTFGQM